MSRPAEAVLNDSTIVDWLRAGLVLRRARLGLVLSLSLVATSAGLMQPWLTGQLIDAGVLAGDFDHVVLICSIMVGVGLLSLLLGAANRWFYVGLSAEVLHELRERLFAHLLTLSPRFYGVNPIGEVMTRLDGDVAEVQRFAVDTLLASVSAVIALVGSLIMMLWLSPTLTLCAAVFLPLAAFCVVRMRGPIRRASSVVREHTGRLASFLVERLQSVKFIQSVVTQQRESERFVDLQACARRDLLRQQLLAYAGGALPSLVLAVATALVFLLGSYQVLHSEFTLGALVAFSAYLARALGPVQSLLGLVTAWQRTRVSLDRLQLLTRARAEVGTCATGGEPARDRPLLGHLQLQGVSFTYEAAQPVLADLDLDLPAGSKLLLRGPSGVGKSTLVDLLHRHYDPGRGVILLDGLDLREWPLARLRRAIAVVAQDLVLFDASLMDNITYADPLADPERVQAAIESAQIDRFAAALPEAYATPIGPRGVRLSGGQRQRVALARAILQQPAVLILDEATSALDAATEAEVMAAVDRLFPQCTRIVISHRPGVAADADRVLDLDWRDGGRQQGGGQVGRRSVA